MPEENVNLVAEWDIINYTISYNLDGGSATNVATYTVNDTIALNNPTRAGYTFTGWTYGGQTIPTKVVSFSNEVGNKTFIANWQANLNTIIFNVNGGVGEMQPQKIYTDSWENLTINSFIKIGYTFMGWATSSSGSVAYYDGANYKMGANSVYNLYAVWSRDAYTIDYNLNNSTATNPTNYNVDTDTFTLNNPTRDGYEFIGWTGTGLSDYTMSVTIEKGSVGNRSYTANWQTTIVLYSNNGLDEQVTQRFINTNSGTINANTFVNGDHKFIGWSTILKGGVVYLDLANITLNQAYTDLYAVWEGTDGLIYELNNGTYTVTDYQGTETDVLVPATYRGNSVTSIGSNAFSNCSSLISIELPMTITSIGEDAFSSCSSLTSIEIPKSVTSIDYGAFYGCCKLESITIPFVGASKSASKGYNQVFGYIFGYTVVDTASQRVDGAINQNTELPGAFEYYASSYYWYYIPTSIKSVIVTGGDIPSRAFRWCDMESVTISDQTTSIGEDAFYGCSSLTSIEIPKSVTSIGEEAFWGCDLLTIYCEQFYKPYRWADNWNVLYGDDKIPTYWGVNIGE